MGLSNFLHWLWLVTGIVTPFATVFALLVHLRSAKAGRQADLVAFGMALWCLFFPIGAYLAPTVSHMPRGPDEILGGGALVLFGGFVGVPCALVAATAHTLSSRRERWTKWED